MFDWIANQYATGYLLAIRLVKRYDYMNKKGSGMLAKLVKEFIFIAWRFLSFRQFMKLMFYVLKYGFIAYKFKSRMPKALQSIQHLPFRELIPIFVMVIEYALVQRRHAKVL